MNAPIDPRNVGPARLWRRTLPPPEVFCPDVEILDPVDSAAAAEDDALFAAAFRRADTGGPRRHPGDE